MNEINNILYSRDTINLLSRKPPIVIKMGNFILVFIVIFFLFLGRYVNFIDEINISIYLAENECYLIKYTSVIDTDKFTLVDSCGNTVDINKYEIVFVNGIKYIKFYVDFNTCVFSEGESYMLIFDTNLYQALITWMF